MRQPNRKMTLARTFSAFLLPLPAGYVQIYYYICDLNHQ
jgi:hypothetical protein